jgi:hypothetical protein
MGIIRGQSDVFYFADKGNNRILKYIISTNTISGNILATQSQVQYLSSGVVKVYQYYNSSINSLDTVFN